MLKEKKIVVVMPAYNAEQTLYKTYSEIDQNVVDEIILVDDNSLDDTSQVAQKLGIHTFVHKNNSGYGANQKTCYREALRLNADVVVMVHPDYQYDPKLIVPLAGMIASGVYDVALGSRILGKTALSGGMPLYKYIANRMLTLFQNLVLGVKLSEYHTGFRAFSKDVLLNLPLQANTNDFAFDNEMLAQTVAFNYKIGEISCPTRYFTEASSISFFRSIKYGFGVLKTTFDFAMWKLKVTDPAIFKNEGNMKLLSVSDLIKYEKM